MQLCFGQNRKTREVKDAKSKLMLHDVIVQNGNIKNLFRSGVRFIVSFVNKFVTYAENYGYFYCYV